MKRTILNGAGVAHPADPVAAGAYDSAAGTRKKLAARSHGSGPEGEDVAPVDGAAAEPTAGQAGPGASREAFGDEGCTGNAPRLQAPPEAYIFCVWTNDGCKLRVSAPTWYLAREWARREFGGEPRLVGYEGNRRSVDVALRWAGSPMSQSDPLRIDVQRANDQQETL